MSSQPSFFGSLFDFSFSRFVTVGVVKFLYVIAVMLLVGATFVFLVYRPEAMSGAETLSYLVLGPIFALIYLLTVRLTLETVVVVFRIGETATEVRDLLKASSSSS